MFVTVKASKQQTLLSNLHERLLQTDQGTYVLCSNIVSPSQNTGELLWYTEHYHAVTAVTVIAKCRPVQLQGDYHSNKKESVRNDECF